MILNTETDFVCEFFHNNARKAVIFDSLFYSNDEREVQNAFIKAFEAFKLIDYNSKTVKET